MMPARLRTEYGEHLHLPRWLARSTEIREARDTMRMWGYPEREITEEIERIRSERYTHRRIV